MATQMRCTRSGCPDAPKPSRQKGLALQLVRQQFLNHINNANCFGLIERIGVWCLPPLIKFGQPVWVSCLGLVGM